MPRLCTSFATALALCFTVACEAMPGTADEPTSDDDDAAEAADVDGGEETGSGRPEEGPCGRSQASRFYVARLELLVDPLDFADESWDWDGGGIEDYWDEWSWLAELLALYTGYGEAYEVVDLLVPLADRAAPILASPYVSPDPLAVWWSIDRWGEYAYIDEVWHDDNYNLLRYRDLEVRLLNDDEAVVIEVYDRDLAFDDYVGWDFLDRSFLRTAADCGPYVYVYTDADMRALDSRVRAIGIEVESW